MKRSFDNSSLATTYDGSSVADDRAMDIDEPNAYQVAMKKVTLVDRPLSAADSTALLASRQTSRTKHSATDIVAMANQITQANAANHHQATGKLALILEQLQFLQSQMPVPKDGASFTPAAILGADADLVSMAGAISDASADVDTTEVVSPTGSSSSSSSAIAHHQTAGKLSLIGQQIKFLHAQAKKVLDETATSQRLHAAACNFRKSAGTVYHLYRRDTGQTYISILSPLEWGMGLPHTFEGSFRLEADSSWTPVDRLEEVQERNAWAGRLMAAAAEARQVAGEAKVMAIE